MDNQEHSQSKAQLYLFRLLAMPVFLGFILLTAACANNSEAAALPAQMTTAPALTHTAAALPTITSPTREPTVTQIQPASPTGSPIPTDLPTVTPIPTSTAASPPTANPVEPAVLITDTVISPTTAPTAAPATPLPTPSGIYSWTLHVPILMYHYISEPPEDADKYRLDLSVTPKDFQKQMAYLADNGFETVDLYDLSLAITNKRELPPKPIIITMDDGYRDNYENAFPVLREHGFEATFFVVTEFIDNNSENYMTWDMVEEMAAAGMRIEPHSKTHADLSVKDKDYVIYEILGSMETIEAHIGERPRFFCYPGGRYNDTTIEVVQELDFWGAVTTESGKWHNYNDRYEWTRLRMRNTTALPEFISMVDPGETVSGKN